MPKNKNILAHAILQRIVKDEARLRVSKSAIPALEEYLMQYATKLITQTITLSEHAKRTTVIEKDFTTALKSIKQK